MSGGKLKIDIRRNRILQQLRQTGKVTVSQLSEELGATQVTIRSDLASMEREGLLLRVQGGAVMASRRAENDHSHDFRQIPFAREKHAIAQAALEQIRDGEILFLNSGTTAICLAESLRSRKNLNVVTNSLAVATILGGVSTIRVTLLGGELNAQYGFTYGGDTQEQLSRYQADWAILSVEGVCGDGSITTRHAEEAVIDRLMIAQAKQVMVVADHTKIGRTGFARVCQRSDTTTLVTDDAAEEGQLQHMGGCGWHVILADRG
jgi:DeoR/GlpR family transcriptional regulator of sugar metabolism